MNTPTVLLLGAAGGAVRGIMHAYDCMNEWLIRRQQYRHAPDPCMERPPTFGAVYDVGGESIAAVVHAALGALVAGVLEMSGQVHGGFAVFAAGASAPLLLIQLKNSRLAEAILGEGAVSAGAAQQTPAASNGPAVLDTTREVLPTQRAGPDASQPPSVGRPPVSGSSSQQGRTRRPAAEQDGAG